MGNMIKLIPILNLAPTVGMKLHIKKAKLYEHMDSNPPIEGEMKDDILLREITIKLVKKYWYEIVKITNTKKDLYIKKYHIKG